VCDGMGGREGGRINDEAMRFGLLGGLLHQGEVSFQGAPY